MPLRFPQKPAQSGQWKEKTGMDGGQGQQVNLRLKATCDQRQSLGPEIVWTSSTTGLHYQSAACPTDPVTDPKTVPCLDSPWAGLHSRLRELADVLATCLLVLTKWTTQQLLRKAGLSLQGARQGPRGSWCRQQVRTLRFRVVLPSSHLSVPLSRVCCSNPEWGRRQRRSHSAPRGLLPGNTGPLGGPPCHVGQSPVPHSTRGPHVHQLHEI